MHIPSGLYLTASGVALIRRGLPDYPDHLINLIEPWEGVTGLELTDDIGARCAAAVTSDHLARVLR